MGTEVFSEGLSLHAGGGAFITSAAFSVLGWQTVLLTTLPATPFDSVVCRDIEKFGVETQFCAKASRGATPQITVAIAGQNDRAFLSHKTGKALPDIPLNIRAFRHLHIGELRSLVEHPDLIQKARSAGATISVDCGWDADLLDRGADMASLLAEVDVFLPNETEYTHLCKTGLLEGSCPLTVVKCGSAGAKAFQSGSWLNGGADAVTVVDATGAGDAFNGGFLSSWLSGKSLAECLSEGNRCGRSSVEQPGGTGGLLSIGN